MSHLEEGLLHALLDGEIPSGQLPPIQAHLASCAECRDRLQQERLLFAEAEGLVDLLEVPAAARNPAAMFPASGRPRWGLRVAWAASLLAAVGLGYAARGMRSPAASRETTAPLATRTDSGNVIARVPSQATEAAPAPAEPLPLAPRPGRRPGTATLPREDAKAAGRELEQKVAAGKPPTTLASGKTLSDTVPATAGAAPAPAAAAAPGSERALGRLRDQSLRLEEVVVTGALESRSAQPMLAPPEPITLPDAMRRLGGTLRLVDGLVPLRLEAQGPAVRVVYRVAQGELVLSQQLVDGHVTFQLIAPSGFPADSLARLRARVRE